MDAAKRLEILTELAEEMGIEIRRAPSHGDWGEKAGAVVRLRGREIVFLDPSATPPDQAEVLAAALRQRRELRDRYLPPEIRLLLNGGEGEF